MTRLPEALPPASRHRFRARAALALAIVALVAGGVHVAPELVARPVWAVLVVFAAVIASYFRFSVSASDPLLVFGIVAPILFLSAEEASPAALFLLMAATFFTTWLHLGSFRVAAQGVLHLGLAGGAFLTVWWLTGGEPIFAVLALALSMLAYYVVRTAVSVIGGRFLNRTPLLDALRQLSLPRLIGSFLLSLLVAMVGEASAQWATAFVQDAQSGAVRGLICASIALVFFAFAIMYEISVLRTRRAGLLRAALALPWRSERSIVELANDFAREIFPSDRIEVRPSSASGHREIVSTISGTGPGDVFLVSSRNAFQQPFTQTDREMLDAIAHIASASAQLEREHAELEQAAYTDELTGLPNYRSFRLALARFDERSGSELGYAVVYLDLDDFKSINDQYGHEFGNAVLQMFARRLSAAVRKGDLVARVGGDEFVVLLADLPDEQTAQLRARELNRAVGAVIQIGRKTVPLHLSHGVAYTQYRSERGEALLQRADSRMYSMRGRALDGETPTTAIDLIPMGTDSEQLVQTIRGAILEERLAVAYQPIVDAVTDRIIGVEALVRYTDPELGVIEPQLLVHEARRLELLPALSRQVLRHAVLDMIAFQELAPDLREVHVNIDVEHMAEESFLDEYRALKADHPGVEVLMELSELTLSRAPDDLVELLHHQHDSENIRFALDDFGKAYSTLLSVVEYPFDVLKVDPTLTRRMERRKSQLVLRSLALLSRKLDVRMIIEGVETEGEVTKLRRLGIRYYQGYFFGRPVDRRAFEERLRRHGLRATEPTP